MTGDVVAVPAFWDAGAPAAGGLDGLQVAGLEHLPCCPVQAQAQPVLDVHLCKSAVGLDADHRSITLDIHISPGSGIGSSAASVQVVVMRHGSGAP